MDCKIIMFKVEKQVYSALLKADFLFCFCFVLFVLENDMEKILVLS